MGHRDLRVRVTGLTGGTQYAFEVRAVNDADTAINAATAERARVAIDRDAHLPEVLNTDKAPTCAAAIAELKAEGKCPTQTRHRQVNYLNNVVEADHGKLKLLIRPVHGFKTLKTAYATSKGFEVMRALRKGQAEIFALQVALSARFGLSSAPSASDRTS